MTQTTRKADDVLEGLSQSQWKLGHDGLIPLSKNITEAQAALLADLLELIGEDEFIEITDPDSVDFGKKGSSPFNELKAELRTKVKAYFGAEE